MFRVTKLADYGVLLMSALTGAERQHHQSGAEGPAPTLSSADLARLTGVPSPTVGKLLRELARHDLLDSVRGVRGGYRLARPSHEISVAELIEAIEGPIALTECLSTEAPTCDIRSLCPTQANWGRINTAIRGALHDVSIDDMAGPSRPPAGSPTLHEVAGLAPEPVSDLSRDAAQPTGALPRTPTS